MKGPELRFFNTIGAISVILVGTLIGFGLLWNRAQTDTTPSEVRTELVTVIDAERRLASPRIEAQGTVVPARQVTLESQVSGRVIRRHPGLVNGGVVQEGEVLLEIDRAKHELERTQLNLERTKVRAPFAALVQEASIEPGELLSSGSKAATLVALDEFWVQVSVPLETLGRLAIPGRDGDRGSRAFVRHESGQSSVEHEGEIIRLLGDLDPAGSMA